jgi:spermidine synthase
MPSHSAVDAPAELGQLKPAAAVPMRAGWPRGAALGLMTASGFAGLGYQIVWTQQGALWLGHEAAAVLAVITAFFGGLSLGALALGGRVQRSQQPAFWYAVCEAVIGIWSLALALWLGPVSGWMLALTGVDPSPFWQGSVAFVGTFLILLPATVAMGATLPAMERVLSRLDRPGSTVAALYASNTLGAVLGVLACAFWLVPQYGLVRTAAVCAFLNVICAGMAVRLSSWKSAFVMAAHVPLPAAVSLQRDGQIPLMLAATGILGIGYEVLVVRVISQVTENTVYTFAILLAVYLVGTAAGAALYQGVSQRTLARRASSPTQSADVAHGERSRRDRLLQMLALACLSGTASLWYAEDLHAAVMGLLGRSMASALTAEAVLALAAFALPTMVMGALFSHLCVQARAGGRSLGLCLGINTLGAAVAPPIFGLLLVPTVGAKWALLTVVAGYLTLLTRRAWFKPATVAALALAVAIAVVAPGLVFIQVPPGGRVVDYQEGSMAAVSVVQDGQGVSRLRINNRQQEGSSATRLADARQALLPLLLHPDPQRTLFLGLGTGVTASTAAEDPSLRVDVAELLPEVISASRHFTLPSQGSSGSRLNVIAADARRYVRASDTRYDVIISDNFHPARSGSASLYTVEHFQAVRARLAEHGLFCQWLPLHQLDLASLKSIVQSFIAVYPDGAAMLATHSLDTPVLGLIAHASPVRFHQQRLRERLAHQKLSSEIADFGIADELELFGGLIASSAALARFASGAPLNTDDHPVVAYLAPRITYAPDSLPRDRLFALLDELTLTPGELIDSSSGRDPAWPVRLAAYWAARDNFLKAGRHVQPSAGVREMLAQVQEPLLATLRISPEFRPAYDPLLRMAVALGRSDPLAAGALLAEMMRLQPARAQAGQALQLLTLPPQPTAR